MAAEAVVTKVQRSSAAGPEEMLFRRCCIVCYGLPALSSIISLRLYSLRADTSPSILQPSSHLIQIQVVPL